jgi:hypothetical protein
MWRYPKASVASQAGGNSAATAWLNASYLPSPTSGWTAVDAFDVSATRWFRAKEIYGL